MNLPWDKYEYSEPFLVQTGIYTARFYVWRRNGRSGQFRLKSAGLTSVDTYRNTESPYSAPNPLELFPPLANREREDIT